MHDELNFGFFKLPTFGFMIAIGVLFLILLLFYYLRKYKVPETKIDNIFIIGAISGMMFALGAYFFDALWHGIAISREQGTPFHFDFGGITFSGGLFTGILCYFIIYLIIMKHERQNVFFYFDILAIGICVAHAFGRLGCFFGGCCYGKTVPSGTFLSMLYPTESGWLTIYPTQLYESGFLFILFIVLVFFAKKNRTAVYLIGYNVFRFFLEYLRGDDRGASPFGALSPSQFMSIIMLIWGLIALFFRKKIENYLLTKNKPSSDYPANDVERTGNGITYQHHFLNTINKNFHAILIAALMIFALTCISFGVFANGVSEKGSIRQVSKKIDKISNMTFNYNGEIYEVVLSMETLDEKETLFMTTIVDDVSIVYMPDLNCIDLMVYSKDRMHILYNATYVYRYQYFHTSETPNDGRAENIRIISDELDYSKINKVELDAYNALAKNFSTQMAQQLGQETSSPLPILYTIVIVLEGIAIILYVLFFFFGHKCFAHTKETPEKIVENSQVEVSLDENQTMNTSIDNVNLEKENEQDK